MREWRIGCRGPGAGVDLLDEARTDGLKLKQRRTRHAAEGGRDHTDVKGLGPFGRRGDFYGGHAGCGGGLDAHVGVFEDEAGLRGDA